jgi:hypothetical protein
VGNGVTVGVAVGKSVVVAVGKGVAVAAGIVDVGASSVAVTCEIASALAVGNSGS